jgi:hypothetical protein
MPSLMLLAAQMLFTAVLLILIDSKGLSQDAHLVASFLFFTMHTLHLMPSLILLAAQMLIAGEAVANSLFTIAEVAVVAADPTVVCLC